MTDIGKKKTLKGKKTIAPIELRKRRVLDAAVAEFLKHGYVGASIDTIARRAGVSKPTIYRWHASKERLFVAAAFSLFQSQRELFKGLPEDTRPPDIVLREAARKWLASYLRPEVRGVVRLTIAEARRFPAIAEEIRGLNHMEMYKPIKAYLENLAKRGIVRASNLDLIANVFGILAVQGFRFMYTEPENSSEDYNHIDTVVDVFLNGCLVRPSEADSSCS